MCVCVRITVPDNKLPNNFWVSETFNHLLNIYTTDNSCVPFPPMLIYNTSYAVKGEYIILTIQKI